MSKSKSKTFPKGTDFTEVADFISEQVDCIVMPAEDHSYSGVTAKYLITITKYPEKEFSEKGREKE